MTKTILAAVCLLTTACVPENDSVPASDKPEKSADKNLVDCYGIPNGCVIPAAYVDIRHITDTNGCDFIVASTVARSSGASVSIIHSPTCKCQKK